MKRRLPHGLDELRGLRYASWLRESTAGQYDRYGPDAQRENVRAFVERFGLTDTGIEFVVAESGRTVWRSEQMARMVECARRGEFDVLVVGYYDRWQRNLRRTLELVEDELHPHGVAFVMADRRLVSSDPHDWDDIIRESHEAERYSRRLGERISDGYAGKFRKLADQGGHAPLGFRRVAIGPSGHEQFVLQPDEDAIGRAVAIFERYAAGILSIRDIADQLGMPDRTLNDILKNPIYNGRVRYKGEESNAPWRAAPPVSDVLWERVQSLLSRRSRGGGGGPVVPGRIDPLRGLLFCTCGGAVKAFGMRHGEHFRWHAGECVEWSGPRWGSTAHYLEPIGAQLSGLKLDEKTLADCRRALEAPDERPTNIGRLRAERTKRDLAAAFATGDIDEAEFLRRVATTKAEERALTRQEATDAPATIPDALAYIRDLGKMWAKADDGQRADILAVVYERITMSDRDTYVAVRLTPDAYSRGLAIALPERVKLGDRVVRLPVEGRKEWLAAARRSA